jgi:hypothetical protein
VALAESRRLVEKWTTFQTKSTDLHSIIDRSIHQSAPWEFGYIADLIAFMSIECGKDMDLSRFFALQFLREMHRLIDNHLWNCLQQPKRAEIVEGNNN